MPPAEDLNLPEGAESGREGATADIEPEGTENEVPEPEMAANPEPLPTPASKQQSVEPGPVAEEVTLRDNVPSDADNSHRNSTFLTEVADSDGPGPATTSLADIVAAVDNIEVLGTIADVDDKKEASSIDAKDTSPAPAKEASPAPVKDATPPPAKESSPAPAPPKEASPAPAPAKEASPTPAKEASPAPAEEATPATAKEVSPEPVKEATPPQAKEASPEPVKDASPEPVKEASPAPPKQASPEPVKEASPEPAKEATPEPVKQESSAPAKEVSPVPVKEESPAPPTKEESPVPAKEASPAPPPEVEPIGAVEDLKAEVNALLSTSEKEDAEIEETKTIIDKVEAQAHDTTDGSVIDIQVIEETKEDADVLDIVAAASEAFTAEVIPDNADIEVVPEDGEEVMEFTFSSADAIPIGAIAVATFAIFLALILYYN